MNPDAVPFVPQGKTRVDEFGNDLSVTMWRPGNGTGRGRPEGYPSEAPQLDEESRGGVPPETDSVADPEPAEKSGGKPRSLVGNGPQVITSNMGG